MIPDFREESCTYLMLRLKVALKKVDGKFSFLGTAAQVKTVTGGFEKSAWQVAVEDRDEEDTYLITLIEKKNQNTSITG
ncbi:MAG TPA: hypothetical protein O0X70_04015 [Methanocorpusculum sp.]|nr:hypothetical protein [Methanocorpusculum sp.]